MQDIHTFTYHFTVWIKQMWSVFAFEFFLKKGIFFFFLQGRTLNISFQVQSPISYLGNTFSTSVKFIFVTLLVSPGESGRGKGSHYSLVLQPACLPPSTQPGEKYRMSTAISHISSGRRLLWRLHLCSKHLKKVPLAPLSLSSPAIYLFILSLPLSLSLFFRFSSSYFSKLLDS